MFRCRTKMLMVLTGLFAVCLLAVAPAEAQKTVKASYKITNLGLKCVPTAMDRYAAGQSFVAGYHETDTFINGQPTNEAVLWRISDTGELVSRTFLGWPSGVVDTTGAGVNGVGQVVGNARLTTGENRAFLYSNGEFLTLPLPASVAANTYASDINNGGQIVGQGDARGLYWWFDGSVVHGPTDLGNFLPTSINDANTMAGFTLDIDSAGAEHYVAAVAAFGLDGSLQVTPLGVLPGDSWSKAWSINNLGDVAGESRERATDSLGYIPHAFVDFDGMLELYDLGGNYSIAQGINDSGLVVGFAASRGRVWQDTFFRAALWKNRSSTAVDLNVASGAASFGWFLTQAAAINNAGQIAGSGRVTSKQGTTSNAFLLTPVQ